MFALAHAHAPAAEANAFALQSKPLFQPKLLGQRDPSTRRNHALPRKTMRLLQRANHLAGRAGISGGTRNGTVSGNLAARDFQDCSANVSKHCFG